MIVLKKGIAVVGSATIDKNVAGDQSYLKLGGVTTYAGISYRRHGIPVLVVSNLAERDLKIIEKLKAEKIEVFNAASDQTTQFVNYIRGDRRHQKLLQQACPIGADQIQALIHRIDGLHLGPLHPLDIDPTALGLLQKLNLPMFLDVQGYTRMVQDQKVYPSISRHLAAGLMAARVVKANESERRLILDFYQLNLAELMGRFQIEEFVITSGKNGGFVQTQSGGTYQYAANSVNATVDSTGAGDVFFAAYILSRFSSGMHIPEACRYAARMAARQVEGRYITIDQLGVG